MLTTDDEDFLRQNLIYDTPMYRCQHVPKRMSPAECEQVHLEMRQELSSYREILRRSLVRDPMMAAVLLKANLRFRTETRAIARALRNGAVHAHGP